MAPYQTPLPRTLRLMLAALAVCAGLLALWATAYAQGPDLPATPVPANPSLAIPPDQVLTGVIPDLPSGYIIIEGDIQVPISEFLRRYSQFQSGVSIASPDGTFETNLWPNGNVPYLSLIHI